MTSIYSYLSSPSGLVAAGLILASAIVIWDWRYVLFSLFAVQLIVGLELIGLAQAPNQWILIQIVVTSLACLIIALSAHGAMRSSPSARQAGSWWLRLMALLLMYGGWRLLDLDFTVPQIGSELTALFAWMIGCALLTLGLNANPLYAAFALLLWMIPVQSYVAVVLSIPSIVALTGILELLIALACSYLLMMERAADPVARTVLTDVSFPVELTSAQAAFSFGSMADSIEATVRNRWLDRLVELSPTTVKQNVAEDDAEEQRNSQVERQEEVFERSLSTEQDDSPSGSKNRS